MSLMARFRQYTKVRYLLALLSAGQRSFVAIAYVPSPPFGVAPWSSLMQLAATYS
jgi:hypothetical protein